MRNDRDQLRQFLVSVILAKPEDASFNNPLCEIAMTKAGPAVAFPSKLAAAAQLAKLTGWNEVEKVSVEAGDTLSAFLRQIVTSISRWTSQRSKNSVIRSGAPPTCIRFGNEAGK